MGVLGWFILGRAGEEIPFEAVLFVGAFVLVFAFFVVAWARKHKRRFDEEGEEEVRAPAERELPAVPSKPARAAAEAAPDEAAPDEAPAVRFELGEARSIREGLERTHTEGFVSRLGKLFRGKEIDQQLLEEVEEVMFTSDIGVKTSHTLLEGVRSALGRKDLADPAAVWRHLRVDTQRILDRAADAHPVAEAPADGPRVIMVIGVNGTGKTTSIGKLAARCRADGARVLLAAGDTFRAAAVEQLEIWARRVGADLYRGAAEADPASVVFDAVKHARGAGHDVVLVDTAGRLHTSVNLMAELTKIYRVIGKALPGAPHEVLLVLDATMGQNAIQQALMFREAVAVNGIVLTKLDGTAKGGVVIGISDQLELPIRWVGVGERVQDMRVFESREFVDALFGG